MSCGNVPDHRRVGTTVSYARAILGASGEGAVNTLPRTNQPLDFAYTEGASRLMAETTYPVHVCTVLRAVRHTGGAT